MIFDLFAQLWSAPRKYTKPVSGVDDCAYIGKIQSQVVGVLLKNFAS